jgi:vacuolar-type H+-ATPase subunit H
MTQAIEEALKALGDFESDLDRIKSETLEAKQRLLKLAFEASETSKNQAIAAARRVAEADLTAAREAADKQADAIRKKGQTSTERFRSSILAHKDDAVDAVLRTLLGE